MAPPLPRIGLVLSAGGLRGAAHLGVLRQVVRHGVRVDVIVGASAGAVVAAYYAAVGLTVDALIADAPRFRARHLVCYALSLRAGPHAARWLRRRAGVIPDRLLALEDASFDRLHHGVSRLGIVCHDLAAGRPRYFATGDNHGLRLADVVRASAAVPGLFRPRALSLNGDRVRLTDGGLTDPLPARFAGAAGLGATHLIVSDCCTRSRRPPAPTGGAVIYIRPDLRHLGRFHTPRSALMAAVEAGEAAVAGTVAAQLGALAAALPLG